MKVSDLEFTGEMLDNAWRGHSVEMPNNDAHRMVSNPKAAESFIESFGDVEIEWNAKYKYWAVPEFAASRERFSATKAEYCARWGCE